MLSLRNTRVGEMIMHRRPWLADAAERIKSTRMPALAVVELNLQVKPEPRKKTLMPIDQTLRGLALEIDASTDPAPEAQPLLEYRFIDLASTQTILARIIGIPQH